MMELAAAEISRPGFWPVCFRGLQLPYFYYGQWQEVGHGASNGVWVIFGTPHNELVLCRTKSPRRPRQKIFASSSPIGGVATLPEKK